MAFLQFRAEFFRVGGEEDLVVRQRVVRVLFFRDLIEHIVAAGHAGEGAGEDFEGFLAVAGQVLAADPGAGAAVVLIGIADGLEGEIADFRAGGGEFFAQARMRAAGGALARGGAE